MKEDKRVTIILLAAGFVLVAVGLLIGDSAVLGNILILAVFLNVFPYFLYRYSRAMWIKSIEAQFPNFIRDMADAVRSGMSLPEAINLVSRSNYGNLSSEVKRMNNMLSWGTPFLRVIEIFQNKTRESKLISEALNIIKESYQSGGDIASALDSVSNDIIMVKEAEAERASIVKQQVFIMYGIFVIFLVVSVLIINIMVPMIKSQPDISTFQSGFSMFSDPCKSSDVFPCLIFASVNNMLGVERQGVGSYYIALFFLSVVIQGLFIGLIAGQIGENSIISGFKHSLVMMISTLGVYILLIKLGIIAV